MAAREPAGLASLLLDAGCTARQSQVLFLCADGLTYAEIAMRLNISFECVKSLASKGRKRIAEYGAAQEAARERRETLREHFGKEFSPPVR
jgi:DNA-binding NarL/FixJ family response regulator